MRTSTLATLALTFGIGSMARAEDGPVRTFEQLVTVTREVTLKGPLGNVATIEVGPEVKRLNEINAGDHVTVDYYIGIAAELRAPTEEEKAQPFVAEK